MRFFIILLQVSAAVALRGNDSVSGRRQLMPKKRNALNQQIARARRSCFRYGPKRSGSFIRGRQAPCYPSVPLSDTPINVDPQVYVPVPEQEQQQGGGDQSMPDQQDPDSSSTEGDEMLVIRDEPLLTQGTFISASATTTATTTMTTTTEGQDMNSAGEDGESAGESDEGPILIPTIAGTKDTIAVPKYQCPTAYGESYQQPGVVTCTSNAKCREEFESKDGTSCCVHPLCICGHSEDFGSENVRCLED